MVKIYLRSEYKDDQMCQNFIILAITTTTSLFLVPNRVKAETFGCKGRLLETNFSLTPDDKFERIYHDLTGIKIPEKFDARKEWYYCTNIHYIKNQGKCGGCWAFAISSVMADRLCIGTQGTMHDASYSEQHLLECCKACYPKDKKYIGGCEGGSILQALKFWEKNGTVYSDCKPTSKRVIEGIPSKKCRMKCTDKNEKYFFKEYAARFSMQEPADYPDIRYVMAEIMLNGPVVGVLDSYKYMVDRVPRNGILTYDKNLIEADEKPIRHAIKIIGWDEIGGISVWTIANSWGEDWCKNGFCYVKRGDFGIEKYEIITGFPVIMKKMREDTPSKKNKTETSGSNFIIMANPIEVLVILCIFGM